MKKDKHHLHHRIRFTIKSHIQDNLIELSGIQTIQKKSQQKLLKVLSIFIEKDLNILFNF